jgi:hypothetical protein
MVLFQLAIVHACRGAHEQTSRPNGVVFSASVLGRVELSEQEHTYAWRGSWMTARHSNGGKGGEKSRSHELNDVRIQFSHSVVTSQYMFFFWVHVAVLDLFGERCTAPILSVPGVGHHPWHFA